MFSIDVFAFIVRTSRKLSATVPAQKQLSKINKKQILLNINGISYITLGFIHCIAKRDICRQNKTVTQTLESVMC